MFGWNDRPTKAKVRHRIGGDAPAVVYEVGRHHVTVPVADAEAEAPEVTFRSDYYGGSPREAFPNMTVCDGEMRIPFSDLVDLVLSRAEPAEIAVALWENEDVRNEFIYAMTTRYSEMNIGDADRRKFLHGVKEAVHDKAVDCLVSRLSTIEYAITREAHHYDEIHRINGVLRELNVTTPRTIWSDDGEAVGTEQVLVQFDERSRGATVNGLAGLGDLAIGGRAWEEARAFWREEAFKFFQAPVKPDEPPAVDDFI